MISGVPCCPGGEPSSVTVMTDALAVDRADGVATLTLNRPESMNSLSVELKEALVDAVAEIAADDSVRAVVLTGAGRGLLRGPGSA